MTISKIQGLPSGLVQSSGDAGQLQRSGDASAPTGSITSPMADTVSLTDSATRLRSLEGTLSALPVVDAQRVEGVQRAIATGSFTVRPQESADKLLEMERSLP
jgi:negative regulator of flagellin synthesis FlgM